MNIEIGQFVLTSEPLNYVLQIKKCAKKSGKERLTLVGYYTTLSAALRAFCERQIRESGVSCLQELKTLQASQNAQVREIIDAHNDTMGVLAL